MARNIDGLVLNGQSYNFTVTDTNLADIETDAGAASKAYAVGEHLILDGQYYVVTAPIAENDGLVVGTNIDVATVGTEITGLRNSFSQALTDLKATPIAQAVGAVGTTFASVIAKLAEIVNHGAWSANMANTGSVTIPKGYHDGAGTVKTSGTATITTNGTHNIAQYSSAYVNVPSQTSAPIVYNYGASVRELSVSAGDISKYKACIACNLGAGGFDYFYINNGVGSRVTGADNVYFYLTQSGGTFTAHSYRYASSNIAMWLV